MITVTLWRTKEDQYGTHGHLEDYLGAVISYTIERPWLDNKNGISCIPLGSYQVSKFVSPSKGDVFLLHDVPGRSMIEIHVANLASELEGCIAVGLDFTEQGVGRSRLALDKLYERLPDNFQLDIKSISG